MTYKDYNIPSSTELHRLQTEPDLAAAVNMAINALLSSVRNVEHLNTEDWNPDTLKLRTKGLTLLEGLHPETAHSIDYEAIPDALAVVERVKTA